MKTKPNILRVPTGYRLDLRPMAFSSIRNTVSGGKNSLEFDTKAAAERKADEIENLLTHYGKQRLSTMDTMLAIDPTELQALLAPHNKTIVDAVHFYADYLNNIKTTNETSTFGKLLDAWFGLKEKAVLNKTLRPDSLRHIKHYTHGKQGFKDIFGNRPISTITRLDCESYINNRMNLNGTPISQVSKIHILNNLNEFFIWCQKTHSLPPINPCLGITILRNENAGEVKYFPIDQATKILRLAQSNYPLLVPYLSICMFSGVRAHECEQLNWSNIFFDSNDIYLPQVISKTHARRPQMQSNLTQWLKWFKTNYPDKSIVPAKGLKYQLSVFKAALKRNNIEWCDNGCRHSAATYLLGSRLATIESLESDFGNSRAMLKKHYLHYPSKIESDPYWQIMP